MTSFGEKFFADVIKLRILRRGGHSGLSGLKTTEKYPYTRHMEERQAEEQKARGPRRQRLE